MELTSSAPKILIMFGGVAVGKTTVRRSVMSLLGMEADSCWNCGADEIQESLPEFKEAFASGDRERLRLFCDESWSEVKRLQHERIHAVLAKKETILLEWCNEKQFEFLAKGESKELPAEFWEPCGYELVICLVKCLDTECAVAVAKQREENDGRHISEEYVRASQVDRAKHFVNAAVALRERAVSLKNAMPRFITAIRRTAGSAAEITPLSAGDIVTCGTEDEAQELLDRLCTSA